MFLRVIGKLPAYILKGRHPLSFRKMRTCIGAHLVLLMILSCCAWGQNEEHKHEEHNNHIGFLIGSVYNFKENKVMLGLGIEYEHVLPFWDGLFGIGLAGEMVFDEHKHYVVSFLIAFHPVREFSLFVAPGILFIDKEEGIERRFAVHFGAEYEFELNTFFLAPEIELAFAGDDIHLMLGFHIGFGF